MQTFKRTATEVMECTSYGKLYQIIKICGNKYIAGRCRRKDNNLHLHPKERVTIEKHKPASREPRVGDFAFVSTDKVWSIFLVDYK
jgi:hypothetical protein